MGAKGKLSALSEYFAFWPGRARRSFSYFRCGTALHPWARFKGRWARQRLASQRASRRLVTLQYRIQVGLMKSWIGNRPVRLDVGNWKSWELVCVRPVHGGFNPNRQATLDAMLVESPTAVLAV